MHDNFQKGNDNENKIKTTGRPRERKTNNAAIGGGKKSEEWIVLKPQDNLH